MSEVQKDGTIFLDIGTGWLSSCFLYGMPPEIAVTLNKGQVIEFDATISKVSEFLGTLSVRLEEPVMTTAAQAEAEATAVPTESLGTTPSPTATTAPGGTAEPSGTPEPTDTPESVGVPTNTPASQPLGQGDVLEEQGYLLCALAVEDPATRPGFFYEPQAGKKLVAVELIVGNVSGEEFSSNVLRTTLIDAEGFVYAAESGEVEDGLEMLDVNPGEKVKGWAGFTIPEDATPASLKYEFDSKAMLQVRLAAE